MMARDRDDIFEFEESNEGNVRMSFVQTLVATRRIPNSIPFALPFARFA